MKQETFRDLFIVNVHFLPIFKYILVIFTVNFTCNKNPIRNLYIDSIWQS